MGAASTKAINPPFTRFEYPKSEEHTELVRKVPRDRDGAFEPLLIPKHARRFTGFVSTPIEIAHFC